MVLITLATTVVVVVVVVSCGSGDQEPDLNWFSSLQQDKEIDRK